MWMLNSPMPEKTPGNAFSTRRMWSTPYMSAGLKPVIIGSKRACSSFESDAIDGRDVRVGERVVVERRVAVQVVGRREVAGVAVRPLLLQRDAEQRRSAHARPHDLEELTRLDALLDVVRQVEVRVVETVGRALSLRTDGTRRQNSQQRQAADRGQQCRRTAVTIILHSRSEIHLEVEVEHRSLWRRPRRDRPCTPPGHRPRTSIRR